MSDLVAFLRARLDEDERVARAAAADYAGESGLHWRIDGDGNVRPADPVDNSAVAVGSWGGGIDKATGEHIVRHDPASALREVEAKRRILDAHLAYYGDGPDEWWPVPALRLLALPYSDHPDYRSEWAVTS